MELINTKRNLKRALLMRFIEIVRTRVKSTQLSQKSREREGRIKFQRDGCIMQLKGAITEPAQLANELSRKSSGSITRLSNVLRDQFGSLSPNLNISACLAVSALSIEEIWLSIFWLTQSMSSSYGVWRPKFSKSPTKTISWTPKNLPYKDHLRISPHRTHWSEMFAL